MFKKNIKTIIIASLVMLLPIIFGVIVWNKLPGSMATHWGINGKPDGYSSKSFCVFLLPLIFILLHWISAFAISKDPKNKNQNEIVLRYVLWLVPALSLFISFITYSQAFGKNFEINTAVCIFAGIIFIFISRLFKYCAPNQTIGIRIKWTLESEENWNSTHRFAARVWFIGGLLVFFGALLPARLTVYFIATTVIFIVIIPIIYSYKIRNK